MSSPDLLLEILEQVRDALQTVEQRFIPVKSPDFFTDTPEGKEKLDGICMQLIAIGESLKNIDKLTDKKLLSQYDEVDWSGAKGVRDIIAHHYFDIDAEEIFWICENYVTPMRESVERMIESIQ